MKKALLALIIAVFCFCKTSVAQITVRFDNLTPQYFTSTLLDNNWTGAPITSYYIDVVNNMSQIRNATVETGTIIANVSVWKGIALRTYPGGSPAIVAFTGMPYSGVFTAGGVTYHISCSVLSPTQLYVRITP